MHLNRKLVLMSLLILAVVVGLLGIALGSVSVPLKQEAGILISVLPFGLGGDFSSVYEKIILDFRLPRVLIGGLVGLILALCGGVMQGIFRNPLADPYLLGIASGATAGAAAAIALHWESFPFALPGAAFLGGLLAVSIVYRIASNNEGTGQGGGFDNFTLILAGVALAALFSAVSAFFLYLAGERERSGIVFWVMGGLAGSNWTFFYLLLPIALVGGFGLWVFSRDLNAIALGDEQAAHLGIEAKRLKKILLGIVTLMTAAAVSASGTIGFVGLIVPHALRLIIGPDHRWLLPASALAGGIFLMLCDTAARTFISPAELPVGIITAIFGAPFFLFLLRRRGKTGLSSQRTRL